MHLPRFPTPIREILPEHLPQARPWARCSGNVTSSSSSSRQNVGQPLLNGSAAGSLGMAEMWRQVENGWEAIGGGKGWAANSGEDAGSRPLWRGESIPPLRDGTSCWGAVGLAAGAGGEGGAPDSRRQGWGCLGVAGRQGRSRWDGRQLSHPGPVVWWRQRQRGGRARAAQRAAWPWHWQRPLTAAAASPAQPANSTRR